MTQKTPDPMKLLEEYGRLKDEMKAASERLTEIEALVDIKKFVADKGVKLTDKTVALVVGDWSFERTTTTTKPSLDQTAAIEMIQKKYPDLVKTVIVKVPTLDQDEFAKAVADKLIKMQDLKKVTIPGGIGCRLTVKKAGKVEVGVES